MSKPIQCNHCKGLIPNARPKSKSNLYYCNSSCAAKVNNKTSVKRPRLIRLCSTCTKPISPRRKNKICLTCADSIKKKRLEKFKEMTLEELQQLPNLVGKHTSWTNGYIHSYNRLWNSKKMSKSCVRCGYSLHVELAHIKGIADFDKSAKLVDVNSRDNLLSLCRNCHWEFDHGFSEKVLGDISKRPQ
jgi:hypothetical protein